MSATEYTVPEGTVAIGPYAFWNAKFLEKLYLPASLTTIGAYAFDGCQSLEDIVIDAANENTGFAHELDKWSKVFTKYFETGEMPLSLLHAI